MRDGFPRHYLRQKGAYRVALVEQFFEHADAIPRGIACLGYGCRIRHAQRPLVGILLNGTSLSTRISPGKPSTRSAMMLRRISSVPPAMRMEGEPNSICWNWPFAT